MESAPFLFLVMFIFVLVYRVGRKKQSLLFEEAKKGQSDGKGGND